MLPSHSTLIAIQQDIPSFLLMYGDQTENCLQKFGLCRMGHPHGIAHNMEGMLKKKCVFYSLFFSPFFFFFFFGGGSLSGSSLHTLTMWVHWKEGVGHVLQVYTMSERNDGGGHFLSSGNVAWSSAHTCYGWPADIQKTLKLLTVTKTSNPLPFCTTKVYRHTCILEPTVLHH